LADGINNLPLASESIDILTYAQAWHWTDPHKSVPEALRVLHPGGALALWWNDSDSTVGWIAAQDARLRRLFGAEDSEPDPMARFRRLPPELSFVTRQVSWTRSVPLETHLAHLASCSDFLVLGKNATGTFLAAERGLLAEAFPIGTVEERYVVSLAVAIR
jgi:SAM-dependent methyltransferase